MMPHHHPPDEILLDYAAGGAPEPMALLVATHLTFCPRCRRRIAGLEQIGGALLDAMEPAAVADVALDRMLRRLEGAEPAPAPAGNEPSAGALLPAPLGAYVGATGARPAWRRYSPRVAELRILPDFPGHATRPLRIGPGGSLPRHGHRGRETTAILTGGFRDERGEYRRGDVAVLEAGEIHRPLALDEGECICLVVNEAPIHFTGPLALLLNRILPTE